MLTKLLKHEFAATARFMWIIYAAMAGLSIFANLSLHIMDRPKVPGVINALMILTVVLWVFSLIFAWVATLVLMLKRFHKNLLTDEGYLMFTLPTDIHSLVIAKLLTAAVWQLATMAMIAICVFLAVLSTAALQESVEIIRGIMQEINMYYAVNGAIILMEFLLAMFLGVGLSCLQFYSAMSIGHGFSNHKVLWSVVFYFVQSTVLQILGTVFMACVSFSSFWPDYDFLTENGQRLWHLGMLSSCVIELGLGAVFYFLTVWNLKHRLNLS